ncbi:restriction endonuclease subunit S [Segatella copri]|jgi:type I restriction enzyme S subunit|uniref:Restriction endonuclease subunit S n=1 Tax=Segatella copri TaxID=165179 RepID=A0AAW5HYI4_9BACT|nr:restriction endonuclease subunit S [Segatella copri]MCP9500071.1 restriction endonuclease subunit S [Segatella copri]MCP9508953.1 restriction endonuclease subunit S [Segatella copri]MCP9530165.1 restriction endonuclease subunit S [Segatella copri]MCP9542262.1 restriction endonuclease subunit S [Segatella copri]MCP9556994.1 restriction endonuclease subunit S [Segatella copri]
MSSYYEKILATGEVKCIDEEIPFDVPNGWEWCRMQDVITFVNGRAYKKEELLPQGKYKVLRVGNFFTNNEWYYSDLELPEDKYCYNGDLLYAWSASFGPQIWNGDKTIFHYHIWNVKFNLMILFREYLYYFFLFDKTQVKASTTGSTMVHVSMENMKPRLIPIPPVNEQKRIVHEIENIIPLIERYGTFQNKKEILDSNIKAFLKKSILQEAIQGKLVPQIPEEGTAQELLEQIKTEKQKLVKEGKLKKSALNDSVIFRGDDNRYYEKIGKKCVDITEEIPFEIPNSWTWARMGGIGDWGAGSTPQRTNQNYYGGNILWLKTGELNNGIVYDTEEKITQKAFQDCSLRMNKIGDVLIAMYGATIGKLAIVGKELTTNQACCGCTPYIIFNWYLFYFLMASRDTFIKKGEGGAQPNISRVKLVEHLIPLPPLREQKRIVQKIEQLMKLLK